MPTESVVKVRTLDGLHLAGTLASPDQPGDRAVVLVHGGGVTREEDLTLAAILNDIRAALDGSGSPPAPAN
jgi:hypothetical protein